MKKTTFSLLCLSLFLLSSCTSSNGEYPALTACLRDQKVVMFGASWCPHCAEQKKLFGRSVKQMPYFECSNNGKQVPECDARGIMSYPTWQFQDATIQSLPPSDIGKLLDSELERVRAATGYIRQNITSDQKDALGALDIYDKKIDTLIGSDLSEYEKLKKLTSLSVDPKGQVTESPIYVAGRLMGERTLSDIAIYAGCTSAYEADIAPVTDKK